MQDFLGRSHDHPGERIERLDLIAVTGEPVPVPDPARLVHLQLRRFAGCPICHLHLRAVARRHHEITSAGVTEVVVFASTGRDLLPYAGELPFLLVADPGRALYRRFGAEPSLRALLHPAAWPAALRGLRVSTPARRKLTSAVLGLPADLLIAPDRTILAAKMGRHADDQWSVDDLLTLARQHTPADPRGGTP